MIDGHLTFLICCPLSHGNKCMCTETSAFVCALACSYIMCHHNSFELSVESDITQT